MYSSASSFYGDSCLIIWWVQVVSEECADFSCQEGFSLASRYCPLCHGGFEDAGMVCRWLLSSEVLPPLRRVLSAAGGKTSAWEY